MIHPDAETEPAGPADGATGQSRFLNRDLSWLEFNARVLAQARDDRLPLLERVKFLAIFTSNLDEFFMKRVGLLRRQIEAGIEQPAPDGMTPRQQLEAAGQFVSELQREQARLYQEEIHPALRAAGIEILTYGDLALEDRQRIDAWFAQNAFPILTPLAVDPGHRFPFISNLSENLGVMLASPQTGERLFARVKIPDTLPRFVLVDAPGEAPAPGAQAARFVSLEQIIRNNLDDLFPGLTILSTLAFRVTRHAVIETDDDVINVLESVESELRRKRFARALRLEVTGDADPALLKFVTAGLKLSPSAVYVRSGPLEYGDLLQIVELERPDLKIAPWTPAKPARLATEQDIFSVIRERDVLLHHPYESFNASVEAFIAAAARDPDVLAIKQTIYRTSRDSPFVASLVRAAEQGKQVACLVELRARFDEHKNVRFARVLEKAGVHVAYGVVGLKTHSKTSIVVRREGRQLRTYAHVGTGNYHPATAQLYTDLSLLTCDGRITSEVVDLFNALTGRSLKDNYERLLVAPYTMRRRFYELIDREIELARQGRPGRIIAKFNTLEDRRITDRLYEASGAGVQIDLIVRGFCCLRPGVPGMSENIRVMSVIGRFLEHSRIFYFGAGREDPLDGDWFIGSADWMYRNLNNRVEATCPVYDAEARSRLHEILDVMLRDHRNAWDLMPDGSYARREPPPGAAPDSPEAAGVFRTLMARAAAG
ncbi:MAG: polyphosphate kinase 1 [Phycisphaerales bacterium JB039]